MTSLETPVVSKKLFTKTGANMTLPFIRKVVKDIKEKWDAIKTMPDAEIEASISGDEDKQPTTKIDLLIKDIKSCLNELGLVGCHMKDMDRGEILFPALEQSQEGYYQWTLGDESVQYFYVPEKRQQQVKP